MEDIRWKQRFANLERALGRLHEALAASAHEPTNALYQIALIGAFQFTFELSWKTLKDYLMLNGVEVSLPRAVIKEAFHHGLIQDGQTWIQMLEDRNLMAHVYQEDQALLASDRIQSHYIHAIQQVFDLLKSKAHGE